MKLYRLLNAKPKTEERRKMENYLADNGVTYGEVLGYNDGQLKMIYESYRRAAWREHLKTRKIKLY